MGLVFCIHFVYSFIHSLIHSFIEAATFDIYWLWEHLRVLNCSPTSEWTLWMLWYKGPTGLDYKFNVVHWFLCLVRMISSYSFSPFSPAFVSENNSHLQIILQVPLNSHQKFLMLNLCSFSDFCLLFTHHVQNETLPAHFFSLTQGWGPVPGVLLNFTTLGVFLNCITSSSALSIPIPKVVWCW